MIARPVFGGVGREGRVYEVIDHGSFMTLEIRRDTGDRFEIMESITLKRLEG